MLLKDLERKKNLANQAGDVSRTKENRLKQVHNREQRITFPVCIPT